MTRRRSERRRLPAACSREPENAQGTPKPQREALKTAHLHTDAKQSDPVQRPRTQGASPALPGSDHGLGDDVDRSLHQPAGGADFTRAVGGFGRARDGRGGGGGGGGGFCRHATLNEQDRCPVCGHQPVCMISPSFAGAQRDRGHQAAKRAASCRRSRARTGPINAMTIRSAASAAPRQPTIIARPTMTAIWPCCIGWRAWA